ncbi:MAG: formylglycine-generating enzyme family protein [Deltaproteobacteria bacterium]|nr:formylglycine-generating enzyme family protein [Deltaproteobacteria bacterium]
MHTKREAFFGGDTEEGKNREEDIEEETKRGVVFLKRTKKKQDQIFSALDGLELQEFSGLKKEEGGSPEQERVTQLPATSGLDPVQPMPTADCPTGLATSPGTLPDLSFIHIPPGVFIMGSPGSELGHGNDEVMHEVTIMNGFDLQITPVTQGQWASVMGTQWSHFKDDGNDHPMKNVSWDDCQEFIKRLNSRGEYRYRLPTEAEWEYACRAGMGGPYAAGHGEVDDVLGPMGWYSGNSEGKSHPVATKAPNSWGLCDMHGNVLEWCHDWYAEYEDKRLERIDGDWVITAKSQTDPRGPNSGRARVARGGSWFSTAEYCRSATRFRFPPESRRDFIGFRLVREEKDENTP